MSQRFDGVDFIDAVPTPGVPSSDEMAGFRCIRSEFASHLKRRVPRDVAANIGRCWYFAGNGHVAGFITLLADRLSTPKQSKLLESEGILYRSFPAVKIGVLATDRRAPKGTGRQLVLWALAYVANELQPSLGVRFVTVDALYDADLDEVYDISGYYGQMGFELVDPNPPNPEEAYRSMYFDLALLESADEG